MRVLTDIQQRILKEEFPDIHFDSDSDIERYFDFRRAGRQNDALAIYNNRIKRKYPDDGMRMRLMGYYRSRDPRYTLLLAENLVMLADSLIRRTINIITVLTREIDSVNMRDAYQVIKLAESLLSIISPDRFTAIAFTEKYSRYAVMLAHRAPQMERTAELIRLYVTDTLESLQELKKEHEQRRQRKLRSQQRATSAQPTFDLSRVVFSPADIDRILISNKLGRTEDQVIAYCLKYWNRINDIAFEKTVFLYSRKNHTKHHDIFQAIKNGRMHNWKDEEILNAVLATVVTGYYYSISGDVYLQRTWAAIRSTGAAPAVFSSPISEPSRVVSPEATGTKHPGKLKISHKSARIKHKNAAEKTTGKQTVKSITPSAASKRTVTPFRKENPHNGNTTPIRLPASAVKPNSIADIIRSMTGKTYTVYKDLFFETVRPSIRSTLSTVSRRKSSLFDSKQNSAEELIFSFLDTHYGNPYQNWTASAERNKVKELGYDLHAIEPIIDHWLKNNKLRDAQ